LLERWFDVICRARHRERSRSLVVRCVNGRRMEFRADLVCWGTVTTLKEVSLSTSVPHQREWVRMLSFCSPFREIWNIFDHPEFERTIRPIDADILRCYSAKPFSEVIHCSKLWENCLVAHS
jgi:hypothetical protein